MLAGGAVEFQVRSSNDVYFYPGSLGSNNTLVRSSNTVNANVWTHVAFTWDQTIQQGRIYLNGTEVSYFSGNDLSPVQRVRGKEHISGKLLES
jgi:hypothetical protein